MSISFDWKSQYCSKEIAFLFCALFLEANTYLLHSLRAKYSVLGAQPVPYISTMICIRKRYVKSHEDTGFWCKDSVVLQLYQRCNRGELFGATSVMQGQNLPPLVGIRYRIVTSTNTCYYSENQIFYFLKSRILTCRKFFQE